MEIDKIGIRRFRGINETDYNTITIDTSCKKESKKITKSKHKRDHGLGRVQ